MSLVKPDDLGLSIARLVELIGLNGSTYYPPGTESEENLRPMPRIDDPAQKAPFSGSRLMVTYIRFHAAARLYRPPDGRIRASPVVPGSAERTAGAGHEGFSPPDGPDFGANPWVNP